MIPKLVRFTGLEFDPLRFHQPKLHEGVVPAEWVRIGFFLECDGKFRQFLMNWLNSVLTDRYALMVTYHGRGYRVLVWFETAEDATLFELMDGGQQIQDQLRATRQI